MNEETRRFTRRDGRALVSVRGDITAERVDAIVNAANRSLMHGGGVAGAISRKGGPEIQEESLKVAPVPTGSAAVTGAGRLPCRFVIHAVGPVWMGGEAGEADALASAVTSALEKAHILGCRTVSLPAISSGIYGFPARPAARVIVRAVEGFLDDNPETCLDEVRFCNIEPETAAFFEDALDELSRPRDES